MIAVLIYGCGIVDGIVSFCWGILVGGKVVCQTDDALTLGGYPQTLLMVLEERLHLTVTEVATVFLKPEHTTLCLRHGDTHAITQTHQHRSVVQAVESLHLVITDKRCHASWQQTGLFALPPHDDSPIGTHP